MTTRSGTMPRSVSGSVARRRPCPVRTDASVPATVTSNGGTEVATSSRRAFAAARTSRTALSPESNRSGTASTVIIMSETVLFSADPPLPHAPVYRLAHPYVVFYRGLAGAELGFCRQVEPGGGLRSWLRWLRSVEAERDGLAEELEYPALFGCR